MKKNGQFMNPQVSEKWNIVLKQYTVIICFFRTVLTIIIVCVTDNKDSNEIANTNDVKTKGTFETSDITYAKCFPKLTLILLFLF